MEVLSADVAQHSIICNMQQQQCFVAHEHWDIACSIVVAIDIFSLLGTIVDIICLSVRVKDISSNDQP